MNKNKYLVPQLRNDGFCFYFFLQKLRKSSFFYVFETNNIYKDNCVYNMFMYV